MKGREPESIPQSGLVITPDSLGESFERAKSLLTQGRSDQHKNEAMIALQMIQNALSVHYEVYAVEESVTE